MPQARQQAPNHRRLASPQLALEIQDQAVRRCSHKRPGYPRSEFRGRGGIGQVNT